MKLEERSQVQAGIEENNSFVSPPIFDLERARKVSDVANEWLATEGFGNFSSLAVACRLGLYNLPIAQPLDPNTFHFSKRFGALAQNEAVFADPANPFPTVGIEVEVPRKIVGPNVLPAYASFFDELGMPRNRVNLTHAFVGGGQSFGEYWEFSPSPSFYAGTQSRIVSELIHGGFIPSLPFSQKPEDIRSHLDDKLVSLHINFGIPMDMSTFDNRARDDNSEAFANMVSLAFTSPLRLEHRSSSDHLYIKRGEETLKSKALGLSSINRFELRALEVRTSNTYRLLRQSQLLGGAFLAFYCDGDYWLSQKWQEFREQAERLTKKVFAGRPFPLRSESRSFMVNQLEATAIQQQLRGLISGSTTEIARKYGV